MCKQAFLSFFWKKENFEWRIPKMSLLSLCNLWKKCKMQRGKALWQYTVTCWQALGWQRHIKHSSSHLSYVLFKSIALFIIFIFHDFFKQKKKRGYTCNEALITYTHKISHNFLNGVGKHTKGATNILFIFIISDSTPFFPFSQSF